jgi:AraC-like DNA-binding protein
MDIQHLVTYIHAHLFDEGLTVTEIKRQCRVHDNNISGRFAYYVGRSIKSYINSHRIRIAKNLLAHKGLKVVQIALVVGYASHGAFTRAFRSHVGCTPSEFQEQIQERSKEKKKERMLSDE